MQVQGFDTNDLALKTIFLWDFLDLKYAESKWEKGFRKLN